MSTFDLLCSWRSCAKFLPRPVEREKIARMLESARFSPSPANAQSWSFVVVEDDAVKTRLAKSCYNLEKIKEAPVIIIVASNPENVQRRIGDVASDEEVLRLCAEEGAVCAHSMMMVAAEEALGTVWVPHFDKEAVRSVLHIPNHVSPEILLLIGYPEKMRGAPKKYPITDATYLDRWGNRIMPIYDKYIWPGVREIVKDAKKTWKNK